MSLTEQERRALFFQMTGRVATIDTQSYFAFCKGLEAAVPVVQQKAEPVATVEERRELRKIYGSDMGVGCSDGFVTDVYKVATLTDAGRFLPSGTKLFAAPVVPADMVMVPRKPTMAMLKAGCTNYESGTAYPAYTPSEVASIYRDMIAAAQEVKYD